MIKAIGQQVACKSSSEVVDRLVKGATATFEMAEMKDSTLSFRLNHVLSAIPEDSATKSSSALLLLFFVQPRLK